MYRFIATLGAGVVKKYYLIYNIVRKNINDIANKAKECVNIIV